MKSQVLFAMVIYGSITGCGVDPAVDPSVLPTAAPTVAAEPKDKKSSEAPVDDETVTDEKEKVYPQKADEKNEGTAEERDTGKKSPIEAVIEAAQSKPSADAQPAAEAEIVPVQASAATVFKAAKLVDPDCMDPALSEIKLHVKITLCDGTLAEGTMVQDLRPANCSGNGEIGCVTTTTFKSADTQNLTAGNLKSGVTVAGVTGVLQTESHVSCSSNSQVGCVTTASFSAADLSNLTAANVKSGVTIAGVTGSHSGETHNNCTADNQTDCVATTSFKAVNTGSIQPGNIRSGVTIAGVSGSLSQEAHSDCTMDNETGCVTTATFRAVSGSAPVPEAHVSCTADNQTGCIATSTYKAVNLSSLTAQNLRAGITVAGVVGTLTEEGHSSCTGNSQTGCVATSTFKSADLSNLTASNVRSGVSLAGVSGSLAVEAHADCTANGQTGCVSNSTYRATDTSNLLSANIKSGVTIAGVTGIYPSASAPLASATATPDLDSATFMAKIKSDSSFEYFDSTGARQTGNGNSLLTASNIKKDVSLFNVTGTVEPSPTIDAWDLRSGITVGSITGKLKAHCRTYDRNAGSTVPTAEKCLDSDIWEDLTSTIQGYATCAVASGECLFKNRISGLYFSKGFAGANKTNASTGCDNLVYGGYSDWRLPSTEEAVQAATMGASTRGFLYSIYGNWSTNVYSGQSYIAIMSNAVATLADVNSSYAYFCVRK